MRPTVFLFDIDGTLISTGGAGRRSMEGAFRDLHGARGVAAIEFSFAGMTDQSIVRTGLRALESEAHDDAVNRLLDAYLIRLADEIQRTETYRVHPGVTSILEWLPKRERAAIGLGTGNVRKGAYAKLARGALDGAFPFGGFGCDAEDRTELLRVGAQRGAAMLGVPLAECRVVVIGDTPKDVAAAHGIGADCIGVGTGGFDPRALVELGAFAAFATLAEEAVREALLDQPSGSTARSSGV
ncbi:MAG: Hydrolase, haloacid dehalogenase-like family [Labilithrix sp.]|nr:Hydrolase, haloacid dehalogenase-like family [Labilithrix sp.]